MNKLPKDLKSYKNVILTFSHYYKYTFYYKGTLDNDNIIILVSLSPDDLYRFEAYHYISLESCDIDDVQTIELRDEHGDTLFLYN